MTAVLTGPEGLPERTLGWAVLEWIMEFLRQPDGDDAGGPYRPTDEQVRFLLWWYALDELGRFLFMRGVLRRAKGWGKSPFVAAMALAELCGPVRFGGWDANGEPVAVPVSMPLVQLAGVSEDQTDNTMSMVLAMCDGSPIVDAYGLDVGLTRIFIPGPAGKPRGKLRPITASAPTAEGGRPTFVAADETHLWTPSNGGVKLARVIRRNLGKIPGGQARMLETTNAHEAGAGSVAESSYDAWLAGREGRTRTARVLYDSREAPPDVDLADEASLMAALDDAYGDAVWVDKERIRDEIWDPSTPPDEARRFFLNQVTAAVDAWLTEPEWAACADASKVVADRETITLGFDGSRGRGRSVADATALIACRVSDGHLFEPLDVSVWEQPAGPAGKGWVVPEGEVDRAVRECFRRYNVVAFFGDPTRWESHFAQWAAAFNDRLKVRVTRERPIHFPKESQTRVVRALEVFRRAVVNRELTHDGSFTLTRHVLNARRHPVRAGVLIAKEHPDSARKIDAAYAAVLAWEARLAALTRGIGTRRSRRVPIRIR